MNIAACGLCGLSKMHRRVIKRYCMHFSTWEKMDFSIATWLDKLFILSSLFRLTETKTISKPQIAQPKAHYDDVIMTMLASQISSLPVVCSIVYSDVNQRKHQSSASLAFVREIHRGPVNFPHKWPVTRKMFPFDDVIMPWNLLQRTGNAARIPMSWHDQCMIGCGTLGPVSI